MAENKTDHALLRIKDLILIGGSVIAVATWFLGIATLPKIVEQHEVRIAKLEQSIVKNDLVVSGIQKDLNYLTVGIDEIKKLLQNKQAN